VQNICKVLTSTLCHQQATVLHRITLISLTVYYNKINLSGVLIATDKW